MGLYRILPPLSIYVLGVVSLIIDPSSFDFTKKYSNQLNNTQALNLTIPHSIDCVKITAPKLPALDPAVCREIIPTACEKLSTRFPFMVRRNQWVWTSLEGCSLAYFFPAQAPRSQFPATHECQQQIYGLIVDRCGSYSRYNGGTINVYTMPTPGNPGEALTHGYPRYLMAPNELDQDPAREA